MVPDTTNCTAVSARKRAMTPSRRTSRWLSSAPQRAQRARRAWHGTHPREANLRKKPKVRLHCGLSIAQRVGIVRQSICTEARHVWLAGTQYRISQRSRQQGAPATRFGRIRCVRWAACCGDSAPVKKRNMPSMNTRTTGRTVLTRDGFLQATVLTRGAPVSVRQAPEPRNEGKLVHMARAGGSGEHRVACPSPV